MPKQYVLFGRPVPRLGTRHTSLLLVTISLFAVFSLLFTLPSAIPDGPSLSNPKFSMPKSLKPPGWVGQLNPFKQPAHPPPRQSNDTDGTSSWYSHFRGLTTPFSSSMTLDEHRSLLPVLDKRPPIYCYYDNTIDKDPKEKDAESALLLAWRKAWWAMGFMPIILSPAEGETNPLYDELQRHKEMEPSLRIDLMRWMAWETMGGGLLAHYRLFPMGPYDDPLLKSLRRGETPKLTRWKDLDDGLFAGPREEITSTIKVALASPHLKVVSNLLATLTENPFTIDEPPVALAYYSPRIVETKYSKIADETAVTRDISLLELITSHLQATWQSQFPAGMVVVKPLPHHTTHMIANAFHLAEKLTMCHKSPIPTSCPPNRPSCTPCNDKDRRLPIKTPAHLSNASDVFTIGTVPHPFTSSILGAMKSDLDIPWVRRESTRDPWITDLTKDLCTTGISGGPRLLRFKEHVASDSAGAHTSIWLLAETPLPDDLDWHFGFALPKWGGGIPPVHDPVEGPVPMPEELEAEPKLLKLAKTIVTADDETPRLKPKAVVAPEQLTLRNAIEAWNLADTEAWRFARAYLARKTIERKKWEEVEAKYADGMGSETGRRSPWDRWLE